MRRSGRTFRLLLEAIYKASLGGEVFIFCGNESNRRRLFESARSIIYAYNPHNYDDTIITQITNGVPHKLRFKDSGSLKFLHTREHGRGQYYDFTFTDEIGD